MHELPHEFANVLWFKIIENYKISRKSLKILKLMTILYYLGEWRSIYWNIASLKTFVNDVVNLLYYEHWTDKWKYFCVYQNALWEKCSN